MGRSRKRRKRAAFRAAEIEAAEIEAARNKRLIEAGETYAAQQPSSWRRTGKRGEPRR